MQELDAIEKYINSVCKEIRNKNAHQRVSDEIRNLILDMRDYYIQQGMDEKEATERAIEETGKAMPLGEQFDKIHLPDPKWAMRPSLSFKTLLRTPLKTLLTFLLLAAASFALFSRVAEYSMISREMDRAAEHYYGVAVIDAQAPDLSGISMMINYLTVAEGRSETVMPDFISRQSFSPEQISAFSDIPQVTFTDKRYMTAGISADGFERMDFLDENMYNQTNRLIIEGTYNAHPFPENAEDGQSWLLFRNVNLLAGNPEVMFGTTLRLHTFSEDGINNNILVTASGNIISSTFYDVHVPRMVYEIYDNPFGQNFLDSLDEGGRYLVIGRWDQRARFLANWLGDWATMDFWSSVTYIDGLPDNYLETEEFEPVRTLIEMTENDRYTFDMVYTSDMNSIGRFAERQMVIREGRALTPEDANTTNCVVNQSFLTRHYLNIGDTITMQLGGVLFEQNALVGAVAGVPERFAPPVETVELTIVGAWTDTDTFDDRMRQTFQAYSRNTIFVPSTLLPVDVPEHHSYYSGEISFIINNARDVSEFITAATPLSEDIEADILIYDGGWSRMEEIITATQSTTFITMVLFIMSAAAALLFSVWLFIGRGMKTFAVMRSLGASQGKAQVALLLPFGVIAILAIPAGMISGLISTTGAVAQVLESIMDTVPGYVPDMALSGIVITTILLCITAFLALTSTLYFRTMRKTPPLALLQSNTKRHKKTKKKTRIQDTIPASDLIIPMFTAVDALPSYTSESKRYSALAHIISNAIRNIKRTWLKSMLSVLLTLLLCGATGVLVFTHQIYEDLIDKIEIKGFITYASSVAVQDAVESELLTDVYYTGASFRRMPLGTSLIAEFVVDTKLIVTNDVERYLIDEGIEDFTIVFADELEVPLVSYIMGEFNRPIVIGSELADILGLSIGDRIRISDPGIVSVFFEWMDEMMPGFSANPEFLRTLTYYSDQFGTGFDVAGILECRDHGLTLFAPVGQAVSGTFEFKSFGSFIFAVDSLEFIVADNERLDEVLDFTHRLRVLSTQVAADAELNIDFTELENMLGILEIIEILFPFAVAAAVLVGILTPALMLMQSTKSAAIMRALGTTRRRTCCILGLEQILLFLSGLTVVITALALYDSTLLVKAAGLLKISVGLYLGGYILATTVAVIIITRHKVLHLLQIKE